MNDFLSMIANMCTLPSFSCEKKAVNDRRKIADLEFRPICMIKETEKSEDTNKQKK